MRSWRVSIGMSVLGFCRLCALTQSNHRSRGKIPATMTSCPLGVNCPNFLWQLKPRIIIVTNHSTLPASLALVSTLVYIPWNERQGIVAHFMGLEVSKIKWVRRSDSGVFPIVVVTHGGEMIRLHCDHGTRMSVSALARWTDSVVSPG